MAKKSPLPTLEIENGILDGVETHAYSNLTAEVGGMLVGDIVSGKTRIIGYIPATTASAEQISLTFTHEVWSEILGIASRDFPDSTIVGWYHTHPSFGLFLSQYDEFIQRNFFKEPGQVALVIDPIEGSLAWFAEQDGEIQKFGQAETRRGPTARPQQPGINPGRGISRAKAAIVIAASLVVGAAIGWGTASISTPPDTRAALASKNAQFDQLRQEALGLSSRLQAIQDQPVLSIVVGDGETLDSIVQHWYGTDQSSLVLSANGLKSAADVKAGAVLLLPNVPGVKVSNKFSAELVPATPTPTPSSTSIPTEPSSQPTSSPGA